MTPEYACTTVRLPNVLLPFHGIRCNTNVCLQSQVVMLAIHAPLEHWCCATMCCLCYSQCDSVHCTVYTVLSTESVVCLWCVSSTLYILVVCTQTPHARAKQNCDASLLTDITQTNSANRFRNLLFVIFWCSMGTWAACKYGSLLVPSESRHAFQSYALWWRSRVCFAGLRLQCKYKGHSNRNTQIRASFSADGSSIICGSDDGHVYIWSTDSTSSSSQTASKKVCCCHSQNWMAVAKRQILSQYRTIHCTLVVFVVRLCNAIAVATVKRGAWV